MTGGEWSSLSNYRSCCELAEAEVLLGLSHCRIFTRQTRVCATDFFIVTSMCVLVHATVWFFFKREYGEGKLVRNSLDTAH